MADYIDWPGKSGNRYRYWFMSSLAAQDIKADGGNYLFAKRVQSGWLPVYIGQADSLKARLPSHDRWEEAKEAGATHVMSHTTPAGEQARLAEEQDLIAHWNPILNTHHRTAPKKAGER